MCVVLAKFFAFSLQVAWLGLISFLRPAGSAFEALLMLVEAVWAFKWSYFCHHTFLILKSHDFLLVLFKHLNFSFSFYQQSSGRLCLHLHLFSLIAPCFCPVLFANFSSSCVLLLFFSLYQSWKQSTLGCYKSNLGHQRATVSIATTFFKIFTPFSNNLFTVLTHNLTHPY